MAKIKFTQERIKSLAKQPHSKRTDYFSEAFPGLCLTIGPRSTSWYYFARVDGKLTRLRLGEWPDMLYSEAKAEAEDVDKAIEQGKHPKAEQARQRTEKRHSRAIDHARLFDNVADAWKKHHLPEVKPQTQAMYKRAVRRLLEDFEARDIATITRGELIRLLDRIKAQTKSGVAANHLAATTRMLWAYAYDRLELENNPAAGLKNPARVKSRERILSRSEIRIVWRACEMAAYPHGHALRLALCTGQRIGEIGDIRRDDLEEDYWRLSRNKTEKRIDVFLAEHARAILDDCPNFGDSAPFFSASDGKIGLRPDGFHNAVNRHVRPHLDAAAEQLRLPSITEHWTPHDLRRTVRSGLTGWAGVFPDIAERTINHSIGGIRAVYDHADYRPHVAAALAAWDLELGRILAGETAAVMLIRAESA